MGSVCGFAAGGVIGLAPGGKVDAIRLDANFEQLADCLREGHLRLPGLQR